jgi:hypothetical protein
MLASDGLARPTFPDSESFVPWSAYFTKPRENLNFFKLILAFSADKYVLFSSQNASASGNLSKQYSPPKCLQWGDPTAWRHHPAIRF